MLSEIISRRSKVERSPESGSETCLICFAFYCCCYGGKNEKGMGEVKKLGIANLAGLAVEKTAEQRAKEEKDAKTHREALINASESLETSYRVGDSQSVLFSLNIYTYIPLLLLWDKPDQTGDCTLAPVQN